MEWSNDHDRMLCKEILYEDPFQFKKGSPDRGEVWSKIARSLSSCTELKFTVKQRSVRERFTLLQAKHKETNRKDEAKQWNIKTNVRIRPVVRRYQREGERQ